MKKIVPSNKSLQAFETRGGGTKRVWLCFAVRVFVPACLPTGR
jgi:hypothetical protein